MQTIKQRLAQGELLMVAAAGRIVHHNLLQMIGMHGGFQAVWFDLEHMRSWPGPPFGLGRGHPLSEASSPDDASRFRAVSYGHFPDWEATVNEVVSHNGWPRFRLPHSKTSP